VRIAGVRVGTVETIGLEGRRARVTLRLEQPVDLTQGAAAALVNAGLLGDKYIEIIPGEPGGIPLPEGAVLEGRTPVTLERALERFDGLGEKLEDLAVDVSRRGDLGVSIRRLVDNLEATSADIRSLVATNKGQVNQTLANFEDFSSTLAAELPRLSAQLTELLGSVEGLVDDNREDLDESLANLRQITDGMKTSVDNLNRISSQIQSGEGTLGKLVYDDTAHDSLVSTLGAVEKGVEGISETLERVNSLELGLALEGFTYTVSHDLKSPLITIQGFLGLLRQDVAEGNTQRIEDDCARIERAAQAMQELLDDLLELSRIGLFTNPPQGVSLDDLAREVLELLAGPLRRSGATVEVTPGLPTVWGDPVRIREVLQNLLENALKYLGEPEDPCIVLDAQEIERGKVRVSVGDNGIGIDPQHKERIFGLFQQLDKKSDGTGVGLALVRRIVEFHGGEVWVESEGPGSGSTFYFTLPTPAAAREEPSP
jgi:virulence factor Mce-like protein